ncbi:MAG TPA: alpha-amylase family glycosyl hydrolase, partial [Chitinophagaceae bacterium]|nr:alpha-amylase family glycosyl hydrolase [Chitinophagaceae bacterium]
MLNPVATYRLQLHKGFTFKDLERLIPYLCQLGIGTVYASPVMQATPGSTHGYDGIDPLLISPEIGTEEELRAISKLLRQHKISWLQDIVPNHMAVHPDNNWLKDVLEKGKISEYASFFDIKWENPPFEGKLVATNEQINYRRFFTVNELICLNIQYDEVFDTWHRYIKELLEENVFQGLRVDHIDGLSDPTLYLTKLRALAGQDCYIVVEKILQQHEGMPPYWRVQGNTGYDFLSMVNNLLSDPGGKELFTDFYNKLAGDTRTAQEQVADKKRFILDHYMQGELNNLVELYHSFGLSGGQEADL